MRQMLIIIWAALVGTGVVCARIVIRFGKRDAVVQQSEETASLSAIRPPQPTAGSTANARLTAPPEHNTEHAARKWDRRDRDALLIAGQFGGKSRRSELLGK